MITLLEGANFFKGVANSLEYVGGDSSKVDATIDKLISLGISTGQHILAGILVFFIGFFLVKILNKLFAQLLDRNKIDVSIASFLKSIVKILLIVLLIISVISALGINTTSFTALLASLGLAIGLALSGNLQNFAGGVVILLFRPFKIGDWITTGDTTGEVKDIQIFHTVLLTFSNIEVFVPNGILSSNSITNYSLHRKRREEWIIGIEYGEDVDHVEKVLLEMINSDNRFLKDFKPYISVNSLGDSSVNIIVRAWVKSASRKELVTDFYRAVYARFNKEKIGFPFPQLTIHKE